MPSLPARVLFGAAYYHEYQPDQPLDSDLDAMANASFSVIRVGESVWSTRRPGRPALGPGRLAAPARTARRRQVPPEQEPVLLRRPRQRRLILRAGQVLRRGLQPRPHSRRRHRHSSGERGRQRIPNSRPTTIMKIRRVRQNRGCTSGGRSRMPIRGCPSRAGAGDRRSPIRILNGRGLFSAVDPTDCGADAVCWFHPGRTAARAIMMCVFLAFSLMSLVDAAADEGDPVGSAPGGRPGKRKRTFLLHLRQEQTHLNGYDTTGQL